MPETTTPERSALLVEADQAADEQLALAKPYPAGRHMALAPRSLEDATRLAQVLCKADMLPKQYHDKPADVLVAILFGADLGLPPMQAIQSIATINGKPSIYGDGFLAVVYAHPQFRDHAEYFLVNGARVDPEQLRAEHLKSDDTAAVCTFWRHGRSQPTTRKFSIGQAKTAKLWTKPGPWTDYPDRMLIFRARGFAGRDAFPDGLRGILSVEEARDIPSEAVAPEIVLPQRASDPDIFKADASTSIFAPAPVPLATPAAPTLPDGVDRILEADAPRENKPTLFVATTERGLKLYAYSQKVDLKGLVGVPVRLIVGNAKWGPYAECIAVEVVK